MFLGALPASAAVSRNLAGAQRARGVGRRRAAVRSSTQATCDQQVAFATLAQRVQANLQDIESRSRLAGAPVGTWLDKYRGGTMAFGLSLWGPDYPDPADYLAFMPESSSACASAGRRAAIRSTWKRLAATRSHPRWRDRVEPISAINAG